MESDQRVIANRFREDSRYFRDVLKRIFLRKIQTQFGDWITPTTHVDNVFFRPNRSAEVSAFREKTKLDFPRFVLRARRFWLLLCSLLVPPAILFIVFISVYRLSFFETIWLGFFCLILGPIPALITDFLKVNYFSAHDWEDVEELDDLLEQMSYLNYHEYSKDDYHVTIRELTSLNWFDEGNVKE